MYNLKEVILCKIRLVCKESNYQWAYFSAKTVQLVFVTNPINVTLRVEGIAQNVGTTTSLLSGKVVLTGRVKIERTCFVPCKKGSFVLTIDDYTIIM